MSNKTVKKSKALRWLKIGLVLVFFLAGHGVAFADYFKEGTLLSTNILAAQTDVGALNQFSVDVSALPAGTSVSVQFSRNTYEWYDHSGNLWGSDALSSGVNNIDISGLNWFGPLFYYKLLYSTTDVAQTAEVTSVQIDYSEGNGILAFRQGAIVSENLLGGGGSLDGNELFGYNVSLLPIGSSVKVQFSTTTTGDWYSSSGELWGEDTLAVGDYLAEGSAISLSALNLSGSEFYYKMEFNTPDAASSPQVTEIMLFSPGEGGDSGSFATSTVKIRGGGSGTNPGVKFRGGVGINTRVASAPAQALVCDNEIWYCEHDDVIANTLGDGDYVLVARADVSGTKQWKTTATACDTPQCGLDGGQDGDNLVASNAVDFTDYPARDACKSIGGRLPTRTELSSIYTNRALFGTFQSGNYWSSTEFSTTFARFVIFTSSGTGSTDKRIDHYVRCVKGY